MADVGRLAGVSRKVVSRVVNGNGYVSRESSDKVKRSIRKLNYRPHAIAQALRTGRTGVILVGIYRAEYLRDMYFNMIVGGVIEEASLRGYSMQVVPTDRSFRTAEGSMPLMDRVQGHSVDGVIIVDQVIEDSVLHDLDKEHVPLVLVNRHVRGDDITCVEVDNHAGMKIATEHLIELGHRKIAIACDLAPNAYKIKRMVEGYHEAMSENGLVPRKPLCCDDSLEQDEEKALFVAEEVINEYADCTAVVCTADTLAAHLIMTFSQKGIAIPERLSISGYNGDPSTMLIQPRLTTVKVPLDVIGKESARILAERIEGKDCEDVRISDVELQVMDSTVEPRQGGLLE